MTTGKTDIEILALLRQGDEQAFRHVYGLLYKPLCYFAETITRSHMLAEDIATDSFIKLLQKRPDFQSLASLKSFLYTTVRNGCIDQLRTGKTHREAHGEIRYMAGAPRSEADAERALIVSEVLSSVHQAIQSLPERYRRVVELALLEGLENEEIARQTGLAYQTVRNHKSEGIRLLRAALHRNGSLSSTAWILCLAWLAQHS